MFQKHHCPYHTSSGHMPLFRWDWDQKIKCLHCCPRPYASPGTSEEAQRNLQRSSSPRPRSRSDTLPSLSNQRFKASGSITQPCFPKVKFPSKVEFDELVTGWWLRTQSLCQLKGRGHWDPWKLIQITCLGRLPRESDHKHLPNGQEEAVQWVRLL